MIARKCERCGAFYEPYSIWNGNQEKNKKFLKPSGIVFANTTENSEEWTDSGWLGLPSSKRKVRDLCTKCMDDLLRWFNINKIEDSFTAADPAAE